MYTEAYDMKIDQRQSVKAIMNRIDGVNLHEKKGGKFRFYVNLTNMMKNEPIESLDLSVRSFNSLKRAGFHTIGDVAQAVASGRELKSIRNCGAKSVREIMEHLFLYQYNSLSPSRQNAYLMEVVMMNL
jgi:DNA-directed RNA polymerase subunit alpha